MKRSRGLGTKKRESRRKIRTASTALEPVEIMTTDSLLMATSVAVMIVDG